MHLITIILGTRPEAIKLAPVIKKFINSKKIDVRIVLTGQHQEMVFQILDLFEIEVNNNLNIMHHKQTLTHITCATLVGLEDDLQKFKPDLVIVQGDTSTAFAGALAAFYQKIPVAHVEAGLRTDNKNSPFPEELNRRLISQIAELHFSPTDISMKNLEKLGIKKVFNTGNTVIDALLTISKKAKNPFIENLDWDKKKVILTTVHRRENWGNNLNNIAEAIKIISQERNDIAFLIPMHKNNIVRNTLISKLSGLNNVFLTEPLNYYELIGSMKNCYFVMTDSGGIQEEAPTFGKPVLILRNNTEREEGIIAGTAKMVGDDKEIIIKEVNNLMDKSKHYKKMSCKINPFGDGEASQRILTYCINFLEEKINY